MAKTVGHLYSNNLLLLISLVTVIGIFVTGFAKKDLIHVSDFATLMSHNFVYD